MSNQVLRQSPLIAFADKPDLVNISQLQLRIKEIAFKSYYVLRGQPGDMVLQNHVRSFFNMSLPLEANTLVENQADVLCWISPDEWMLIANDEGVKNKFSMFEGALANHFTLVSDVSSAYTMLQIEGSKSFEVLSKAMTFDVHPQVFKPGQCVSTTFAKAQALVYPQGQYPNYYYNVIVRRSFADYIAHWLKDACSEYQ